MRPGVGGEGAGGEVMSGEKHGASHVALRESR